MQERLPKKVYAEVLSVVEQRRADLHGLGGYRGQGHDGMGH